MKKTMKKVLSQRKLPRSDLLKLLTAGGIAAAGGYALLECAPWIDEESAARRSRRPLEKTGSFSATQRELVRFATLAASGHNAQPWKFALGKDSIEIHPDFARRLPAVDPQNRELWISLGCALENLVVAARAAQLAPEVTYPGSADVIRVKLSTDSRLAATPLFPAILTRQNTRSEYDGRPVPSRSLDALRALPLEPGIGLRFVESAADRATVSEYVRRGNLAQYADEAFVRELESWIRFNKKEALATCDGLYSGSSGSPDVPRWLGKLFVAATKPGADEKKLRSASGVILITSESDDKSSWVRVGQVYERLALTLTSMNLKLAFVNQPIEVENLRSPLQSALGLGKSRPQLLLRFGYANPLPLSLRRPLEQALLPTSS